MNSLSRTVKVGALAGCLLLMGAFFQAVEKGEYPAPRFPSYLKAPQSAQEVMKAVRGLVRNPSGFEGLGLGIVREGETVLLVPTVDADEMIIEGIRLALEERGVKALIRYEHDLVGVSREDAMALKKATQTYNAEQGYMEGANWVERVFPDAPAAKAWLKGRNPELYGKVFPERRELSDQLKGIRRKLGGRSVGRALQVYLEEHPEVRGILWGKGGGTGKRRDLYPHDDKYLGMLTADNRWEAMSQVGTYPADLWQLTEELTIESLSFVDRLEVTDPEGTDVYADLSRLQAERWARGVYQRGHLYMFPNIATGRFGYSVVNYPSFQKEWLPREPVARLEGKLAGTNGHGGFFPRWEVTFEKGFITDVKGGGLYGDLLREFLQYPKINDLTFPFHEEPGFWYLYEIAFGTNPKYFRNPKVMMESGLMPERMVAGVVHWGLGIRVWHDPDAPKRSEEWREFTARHNVPADHNFHTHTYFTTYRVHLRGADRWLNLLDKGRMTSLDNPEARALASRYGDPDQILSNDWIPEVAGINAPGNYQDYAANPWKYSKGVIDKVIAGDYEHFYPPPKAEAGNR